MGRRMKSMGGRVSEEGVDGGSSSLDGRRRDGNVFAVAAIGEG